MSTSRHEQAHVVAPQAARFRRLRRFEVRRQRERRRLRRLKPSRVLLLRRESLAADRLADPDRTASARTARSPPAAADRRCPRLETPPDACACACRRDRRGRPTRPGRAVRPPASASAARAPPCWRRTVPSRDTRAVAASLVMFTMSPRRAASSGTASWISAIGAPALTGNTRPKRCTSNASSGPMPPSSDALLTSTSRPPSSRRRRSVRRARPHR